MLIEDQPVARLGIGSGNTVAVMLEPIQGEAGVWQATDQFLAELQI